MRTRITSNNDRPTAALKFDRWATRPAWLRYSVAIIALALATLVNLMVDDVFPGHTKYLWLLLSFVFTVWFGGLGPAIFNLLLGPVVLNFFIMHPRFSVHIESPADRFGVLLYIGTTFALFAFFWQRRKQCMALADADRCKDDYLAVLSHELRNPLAAISNAVHLLGLQKHEDQLQRQSRAVIERQVEQMVRLIDDLLEVSRINTGKFRLQTEQVDLNAIVAHALETIRPTITQHRHELTVSILSRPIWVFADAARLEQVFGNLLTNAAKYTNDGGQIWIGVQQEGEEGIVRVRDAGVGISPKLLPHIFDLFTQAERSIDRSKGGLGIGLALVKQIVELHEGRVEVVSTLGQGSEFVVYLPLIVPAPQQSTSQQETIARPVRDSLRVVR